MTDLPKITPDPLQPNGFGGVVSDNEQRVGYHTHDGINSPTIDIRQSTPTREANFVVFGSDTAVAIGDGTIALPIPKAMDGLQLQDVLAAVHTKGITGTTDIQVRRRRGGNNSDMLSTKVTIGNEFFARDGIVGSITGISIGDQVYVDVDAVHSGTAPNGLSVVLSFS